MLRTMWLIYFVLSLASLDAQITTNEISYTGVYKGTPLFVQNPYVPHLKTYCIKEIRVNKQRMNLDYNRSALILSFDQNDKFTPVSIQITYADSTCVPIFLNPDAITYHSVFGYDMIAISDSSIVWKAHGEEVTGVYQVEVYNLGFWEPEVTIPAKGIFGGTTYEYFPRYKEGINKYRVKYAEEERILYSEEVEYVFYAEAITFRRQGNMLVLSRGCDYIVFDAENNEVLSGSGKEINIASIPSGDYTLAFNEKQYELFRKNDAVKVIKPPKSNN
jgi:hypothetical protein